MSRNLVVFRLLLFSLSVGGLVSVGCQRDTPAPTVAEPNVQAEASPQVSEGTALAQLRGTSVAIIVSEDLRRSRFTPSPSPSPILTPKPTAITAGGPTAVSDTGPTPDVTTSPSPQPVAARVTRVIDGDTLEVRLADGSTERIRFLGVDAPETFAANKSGVFDGVTDTACLDHWGALATSFVTDALEHRDVQVLVDPAVGRRYDRGRLLAYVHIGGVDFNAQLVELGYARVYEEGDSSRKEEYLRLERQAQSESIGLWECAAQASSAAEPAPTAMGVLTAIATPSAAATPAAVPTPTPEASPNPSPTATPEPSPSPTPTLTPAPTAAPTPSPTVTPTQSPTITPTASPIATPMPSPSPGAVPPSPTSLPFTSVPATSTQPPTPQSARPSIAKACDFSVGGEPVFKGNVSSSGENIYHTPESPYYARTAIDETKGEKWFCTEKEAIAEGWRAPLGQPSAPTGEPTATAEATLVPTATASPSAEPRPAPAPSAAPSPVPPPSATPTPPPPGATNVQIECIFFDGVVSRQEPDEYVQIVNVGDLSQDLSGWRLEDISDDRRPVVFKFTSGILEPGGAVRVYTNEVHPEWGGFSFGRGSAIWNNSDPDTAALLDETGSLVSSKSYPPGCE